MSIQLAGIDEQAFNSAAYRPEWRPELLSYIPVTSVLPANWGYWFWDAISTDAPFSWGDNNRTLVSPSRFIAHVRDTFVAGDELVDVPEEENAAFSVWLSKLSKFAAKNEHTYIDLEN